MFVIVIVIVIVIVRWLIKLVVQCFYQGRGTVATGCVEQGIIKAGEEVEIMGLSQVTSLYSTRN